MRSDFDLRNGDSLQLMNAVSDDAIVVTDPPFNVGYHYDTYKDRKPEDEYYGWLARIFGKRRLVMVHYPEAICRMSIELGCAPVRIFSWVYNSNTARQHRDIAYWGIKPEMGQYPQPYKNPTDKRIAQRIRDGKSCKMYDWFNVNQVKNVGREKTGHPCQMPAEVMERAIAVLPYDCTVVDPFMGSGTTGVAVMNMNEWQNAHRKFIGFEMDEKYFDIASERIFPEDIKEGLWKD